MNLENLIVWLEEHNRLERIDRAVDAKFEIGEITRMNRKPLLFTRISRYPGCRVYTNGLSTYETMALALGFGPGMGFRELVRSIRSRLQSQLPPVVAKEAPPGLAIRTGDRVQLTALPIPWWSPVDANRYVGTWHINITVDPETGERNLGVYRMQVLDENHATVSVSPHSHLAIHMHKAEKAGKPLPMAVAIGVSETAVVAAASAFPAGHDEYAAAGALGQQPLELWQSPFSGHDVPVDFGYLLEGRLLPGERAQDGPYLDYAGIPSINPHAFVFAIDAITEAPEPLFRGTSVGVAGAEDHVLFSVLARCGLVDFHGARMRRMVQNFLLRRRWFRLFQYSGRIGAALRKKRGAAE